MCIVESDTVKSDFPMQENYEIFKDLIQSVCLLTSFTVCSRDIKKKEKSSENDQVTGHFQSFFLTGHFQSFFFSSPRPQI